MQTNPGPESEVRLRPVQFNEKIRKNIKFLLSTYEEKKTLTFDDAVDLTKGTTTRKEHKITNHTHNANAIAIIQPSADCSACSALASSSTTTTLIKCKVQWRNYKS